MRKLLRLKNGYSLVEMAIVVLVGGIVMGAGADVYRVYNANQLQTTNVNNVTQVAQAIGGFLTRFGRYPCPADISLKRTDPNYGMETGCDPNNQTNPPSVPPYEAPYAPYQTIAAAGNGCVGGICIQTSLTPPPSPLPSGFPPGAMLVRRGGIPFRAMNIPEAMTLDAYGNRLQYAVTQPLAVVGSYNKDGGAISVTDQASGGVMATGIHFVIFSSGPDQAGAYSRDGAVVAPCGTPASAYDAQNCTTSGQPVFNTALYNPIRGAASHYDDTLQFFTSMASPLWKPDPVTGLNINDTISQPCIPNPTAVPPVVCGSCTDPAGCRVGVGATPLCIPNPTAVPPVVCGSCIDPNGCRVGVGTVSPTTTLDVWNVNHVSTVVQPGAGALVTQTPVSVQTNTSLAANILCDNNGNCLNPVTAGSSAEPFTGTSGGNDLMMNCPQPGQPSTYIYVTGISLVGNAPNATLQVQCSPTLTVSCPSGQFVVGINSDGSLVCNTTVTQCNAGAVPSNWLDASPPLSEWIGCDQPTDNPNNLEYIAYDPTVWLPAAPIGTTTNVKMSSVIAADGASAAGGPIAQAQMQAWLTGGMSTSPGPQYTWTDTYTCMPSGQWIYQGSNGWCGCMQPAPSSSGTCSSMAEQYINNFQAPNNFTGYGTAPYNETWTQPQGPGGVQCGGGWANTYNSTFTFTGSGTTYTYNSQNAENNGAPAMIAACDACNKNQAPMTNKANCTPKNVVGGYTTGKITTQQTWDCSISPNGFPGGWDPPTPATSTCTCAPSSNTSSSSCASGFTGGITTETDITCSPPDSTGYNATITSIVGPYVKSDTCQATCLPSLTQTFACSDPTVQVYDPSAYSTTDNSGSVVMSRAYNCATQTYSAAWTPVSSTCNCAATSQTQDIACPTGQTGQQAQQRSYNCTTGVYGPWTDIATGTTCAPVTTGTWAIESGAANSTPYANNPTGNVAGQSCPKTGTVAACGQQVSGGWTYYQTCYCQ